MDFLTKDEHNRRFAGEPQVNGDSWVDAAWESWSWGQENVVKPSVNVGFLQPVNAAGNLINEASRFVGGYQIAPKLSQYDIKPARSAADWWVQNISSGLAATVPYAIAGKATGAAFRKIGGTVGCRVALKETTAQILGAGIYDGARDVVDGETRFGNAVGGMFGFAMFEHGNALSRRIGPGNWAVKGWSRALIGGAGASAQLTVSELISKGQLPDDEQYKAAFRHGAAMNVALPVVQDRLGLLFGNRHHERLSSLPESGQALKSPAEPRLSSLDLRTGEMQPASSHPGYPDGATTSSIDVLTPKSAASTPQKPGELSIRESSGLAETELIESGPLGLHGKNEKHSTRETETREAEGVSGKEPPTKPAAPKFHKDLTTHQLAEYLRQNPETTHLDLSECRNVTALPESLPDGLQVLNLSECSQITQLPEKLPSGLKVLNLSKCIRLASLPAYLPQTLTHLDLSGCKQFKTLPTELPSTLEHLSCNGWDQLESLPNSLPAGLLHLGVSGCKNLKELPLNLPAGLTKLEISWTNFTHLPENLPPGLKELDLTYCRLLTTLPEKLPPALKSLTLSSCEKLVCLPTELPECLQSLNLRACEALKTLPEKLPKALVKFDGSHTGIGHLPDALPPGLKSIDLSCCDKLTRLAKTLPEGLQELIVRQCHNLRELPESLPTGLLKLDLGGCRGLEQMPVKLPTGLREITLQSCFSLRQLASNLPETMTKLDLRDCHKLTSLPESLPSGLTDLKLYQCMSLTHLPETLPDSLVTLDLTYCPKLTHLPTTLPKGLKELNLRYCKSLTHLCEQLPDSLGITCLDLSGCESLTRLPKRLPDSIVELNLTECRSLTDLTDISSATLQNLKIENCEKLTRLPEQLLSSLTALNLIDCPGITQLSNNLTPTLQKIKIRSCQNLTSLSDKLPSSLQDISIDNCSSLTSVPDNLPANLQRLSLVNCQSLTQLPLSLPSTLQNLTLSRCHGLRRFSDAFPRDLLRVDIAGCENLICFPDSKPLETKINANHDELSSCLLLPASVGDVVEARHPWQRLGASRVAWEEAISMTTEQVKSQLQREFRGRQLSNQLAPRAEWLQNQKSLHRTEGYEVCPQEADRSLLHDNFRKLFELQCQRPVAEVLRDSHMLSLSLNTIHGKTLNAKQLQALREAIVKAVDRLSDRHATEGDDVDQRQFDLAQGLKAKAFGDAMAANVPADAALQLSLTFGKNWKNWLSQRKKAVGDSEHFLHDATYWLPLKPTRRLEGLGDWLLHHRASKTTDLELVAKNWDVLEADQRQMSVVELTKLLRSQKYSGQRNEAFAKEASQWGVAKDRYGALENRFIASQSVPSPFPLDQRWTAGDLVGRFLPRRDPRGLFLGQHTLCCQHPDGVGSACAFYGQEKPNSGFFVVENAHGKILGQSWTWISDNGGLCFDNVEAIPLDKHQGDVLDIYKQTAQSLSPLYHTITLGTGGSDLDISKAGFESAGTSSLALPKDFSGHTDSAKQVILATNKSLSPRDVPLHMHWVRGALQTDIDAARKIARSCYPDGWRYIPNGFDYALMLDSRNDGPVGYATLETGERYISDIAILPEYRSKAPLLVNSIADYIRQSGGGQWTADCRESTSYRLMQGCARRGQIQIHSISENTGSMNGEPMHRVTFSLPPLAQ